MMTSISMPSITQQITNTKIVIFAKYPIAGQVKTRLIPALGADKAAQLAARLLQHTLTQAVDSGYPVELCGSPAAEQPCWQSLKLPAAVQRTSQCDGDLGVRMAQAAERVLATQRNVILIGTDCPSLDTATLQHAAEKLEQQLEQPLAQHDAVIIPASDGGYVLLGLRRFDQSLFEGIAWSSATVCADTLQRLQDLGWSVSILPTLHDIDEPEDLQHLPDTWQFTD